MLLCGEDPPRPGMIEIEAVDMEAIIRAVYVTSKLTFMTPESVLRSRPLMRTQILGDENHFLVGDGRLEVLDRFR